MSRTRLRVALWASLTLSLITVNAVAQTTPVNGGLNWLTTKQNANGTWGAVPELVPRDTARALYAMSLHKSTSPAVNASVAWLGSQRGFEANQFLAEQTLALSLNAMDTSAALTRLVQQRSTSGADFGGFIEHAGDSYDSALALQALATNEGAYSTAIAGVVTTLITRQNADGGWGIDQGFESNVVMTAEVLMALSVVRGQQAPPATITAAQTYLASRANADGSIGTGVLETAVSFRALALSGYALSGTATATLNYLGAQKAADGSWGGDAYLTARVLEAYAANKPNLTIKEGDLTLNPSEVSEGGNVTASIKVTNIGAASSAATNVTLYVTDTTGRNLGTVNVAALAAGASATVTRAFAATQLTGTQSVYAIVDGGKTIDEMREDDNSSTATLKVAGKPDLQVFSADILTSPARLQPQQAGTLTVTIRNNGEGDATSVGYAIYDGTGSSEVLLKKDTIAEIGAGSAQVVQVPVTLAAGSHAIQVIADPDAQITESSETNNSATRSISVTAGANVDLRITAGGVETAPNLPAPGSSITIWATVANGGGEAVKSTIAFYDGVPGSGGVLIGNAPVTIAAGSSTEVPFNYTTTADSKVVYAVADPDNLLPELDETNNQSFALLTNVYADLVLSREGFVLPRGSLSQGQSLTSRLVVRNNGSEPVSGVRVVIYDDIPQNGGTAIVDKLVDVPAQGKVVVEGTWTVRAGQRFATAVVNPDRTVFEPDYANNKVVKLYMATGSAGDIKLNGTRAAAIDVTGLTVDKQSLTATGILKLNLSTPNSTAFTVTLFEDIDGDLAFNPEVDSALGSTLVQPGVNPQLVQVSAQGSVRFAPGKLAVHLDSSNAIAESIESNNLIDVWQDCQSATPNFKPAVKWSLTDRSFHLSPVARIRDTNGDDVIDDNDAPMVVVATGDNIALHRGDTGQRLWIRDLDFSSRQVSPVIADIDGDKKAEIIAHGYEHRIIALNAEDGTTQWASENLDRDPTWEWIVYYVDYSYGGAPVVADLDGDGAVEVISGRTCLRGADGTVKWIGTGGAGRAWQGDNLYFESFPDQEAPIAVDVNNDGKLEVVAGNTAYKHDGSILWRRGDLPDGYTSPVWLPNQTTPKICLVANGGVWMLNSDGSTLWGRVGIPNGALLGGAPTVFMDGSTGPWVGVAGDGYYSVFNATTGAVRWTKQVTTDFSFGGTTTNSATAFDFGGGMTLAYASRSKLVLMRASDGAFMYEQDISNNPFYPMSPVVADVDGDFRADLVVPGRSPGVQVLSDPTWRSAPAVFNEASYHVVNVLNEQAEIPKVETQTSFSKTHYRTNTSNPLSPGSANPLPNLSASYMRADTGGFPSNLKLTVRVGNNGWTSAVPVKVGFYYLVGATQTLAGTTTSNALAAGEYQDVVFTFNNPPATLTGLFAKADSDSQLAECNETDNQSSTIAVKLTPDVAIDPVQTVVSDAQPNRGETIEFLAAASISSAVDAAKLAVQFYLGDPAAGGTAISPALTPQVAGDAGNRVASIAFTWNVSAPAGQQTVYVVFDPANVIAEDNEANNKGSYALTIGAATGQPDLQVFPTDIVLTPAQLQPNQPATLTITVRNNGKGDAANVVYDIFDVAGATQTRLQRGTIASLPLNSSALASASISLTGGAHTIRVVVDPDNAVAESNETNNTANKTVDVSAVANVDLRVTTVTATPNRPAAGQSISISATVTNGGAEPVDSKVALYDGNPGGTLIKLFPVTLAPQASATLTTTYTTTANSKVVYAVADPDDVINELDETNNAAFALLTDNYSDLVVTRNDITLSNDNLTGGQSVVAAILVRNTGPVAASNVPVVVYDDLVAGGGREVLSTTVNVPANGSVSVPATWAARAGQRFATVVVNGSQTIFEPSYTNNTATRFYTASGDEPDLSVVSIDTSAVLVDSAKLSVSGDATLVLATPGTKAFTVMVFEDADGDGAYSPAADFSLGAALVQAGAATQSVTIPVSGTLRFAPGKLMVYVDSTNNVSETDETNNLRDLWQLCTTSRANLTASYVRADTSGYPSSAVFVVRVGNNGAATAVQSGVTFHAVSASGTTNLGTAVVPSLAPGAFADVQLTVANPSAAITGVYATADGPALITECSETDNKSETVAVQFSADILVDNAMLLVSDPQPRQGDAIDFVAVAQLKGAISATPITARFYLGNPATGGTPISNVLTAVKSTTRGLTSAVIEYTWPVTAVPGPAAIYVLFDPDNAIAEDDESNNDGIFSLNVTSPEPVRKLSGTITLDPPASEPGAPVAISILIKNIGNVPLENFTLSYAVSGGAGTGFNGSQTITSLPKNDLAVVSFGKFTPQTAGEYTVTVTPNDSSITLVAGPKAIKIAPFAGAAMTAAPKLVPVSLPLVQAHTKISRGNTIVIPDDPLVPLLKTHIQRGLNWQATYINADLNADFCFRCHVTAQGMVSFEESRKVSGVTVNETVAERIFQSTIQNQWANGQWHDNATRRSTTAVGGWALSYWHDSERVKPYLIKSLEGMLQLQNASGTNAGAWECDHCYISYGSREAHTMMGIIMMARGWELTKDQRYYDSMTRAVDWALKYDAIGNGNTRGQEWPARIAIGLSAALPQITDEALASAVKNRIDTIAAYLRSTQNADGSFGPFTSPDDPVIRTAQSLYALSLAGVPGTDASLRSAIVWLLNRQQANGAWREVRSDNNQEHWVDETTWAMIALPAAFLRLGQFDVDYEVLLPSNTEYVSASPAPNSVNNVAGGKQILWKLKDVTEAGQDVYLNVNLTGIRNNEQRSVAAKATLNYQHPYTGAKTSRTLDIPQVTGFAPLKLAITTDKPSYAPNSTVEITEVIENVGAATVGVTNDVVIRDANGTTVATIATNDVVEGFPADPFPAWNFAIPVTVPVTNGGVNRIVLANVDFAAKLAALGVPGTFDQNSIRISADSAAAQELFYTFTPDSTTTPAKGRLVITIPDSATAGTTLAMTVYFDIIENGFKPVSMFDRNGGAAGAPTTPGTGGTGATAGMGFLGRYYRLDTSRQTGYVNNEADVKVIEPPVLTRLETNSYMQSNFPAGVQRDYFVVVWTGAFYAPTAGTYQFELGSDDGSWLTIDGVQLINNGGGHGVIHRYASKTLTAGFHTFRVTMFEWGGGEYLTLAWAPPGKGWEILPPNQTFSDPPAADPTTVVVGDARQLTHGIVTRKLTWNTGVTNAGPYSAVGTLKQNGTFIADAAAPFTITPAAALTGSIATDKPAYDSGETVRVTAGARYDSGNVTLTNLQAVVSILDAANAVQSSATTNIASLIPGQSATALLNWPAGTSTPGTYTAKLVVLDSSGTQVATASVPFELRSSAVTGKGVTGTISTPPTVQQGESLPISVTLTNGGNSTLTNAPFAVTILDPVTQAPVATINFTATIAAGATFTTELAHPTAGMALKTYQAWLASMITGTAVPFSSSSFEVKPPPLKLEVSVGGPSRVLIWADCANGNSAQPCTATAPPFLTSTLTAAGIPWTLVGTQDAALAALRTGGYDEVILYQKGPYEAKISEELVESVRAGLGLLLIKPHADALPQLTSALGTKFTGKLNAASTLLDVLNTPFTAAGQLTVNGDGVKIELDGASAAANIAATQAPAISYNTFGAGRVVVVPFDTELTPTTQMAKLLVDAVDYVARTHGFDARQVVALDFLVTPPPGAPANLTIGVTLPDGMTIVHASPALSSTSPAQWNVTSSGEPFHLYLWVRLPDAAGTYTVTGTAGFAGQLPVVTKTLAVTVTADRAAIEASLTARLDALAAAAPSKDKKAVTDAQTHLTALKAAAPTDAAAAIARIFDLIKNLQSVSIDSAAARNDADRLLVWWQSRA